MSKGDDYKSRNGVEIPSNRGNLSVTPTTSPGTTLRAMAFAENGMSDSELQEANFLYLGPHPGEADPSSATLSAVFDSPPAGVGSPSASFAPGYDHNGNLISYKGWSYSYDAQNRLTRASDGAHTALFHYDGKNRQIMRSINAGGSTVVRFSVWDDWELLEEYDTSNAKKAAYLQGAQGVIKSWGGNGTVYYYQDKLGSTTHIADAGGNLLESYRYDLYGTPSCFDSTPQPINSSAFGVTDLYAGERWIGELRLYDLRNRFMSPELGRFLQTDPVGFQGDANNLYRYCHNDPEDFSDPMGLYETPLGGWDVISGGKPPSYQMEEYHNPPSQLAGGGSLTFSWEERHENDPGKSKRATTPERRALTMLREEARGGSKDKTGEIVLQNGQIRRAGPVEEQYVKRNPFDFASGNIMAREHLKTGGKALWIVHYHWRGGREMYPTPDDYTTMKQEKAPMMFTSKGLAKQGQYQILRPGYKPEVRFDRQLYLERHNDE
jgi:RHS repeat-associated protein